MVKKDELWKSHITGSLLKVNSVNKNGSLSGKVVKAATTDKKEKLVEDKTSAWTAWEEDFVNYCKKVS